MTARAQLAAVLGIGLVLAATVWLMSSGEDGGTAPTSDRGEAAGDPSGGATAPRAADAPPAVALPDRPPTRDPRASDADPVARATRALAEARAEHAAAARALVEAERAIDDLEREVEAVERFVADIEASGDDPARHAFEGMERLGPVIERYEARLADLDAADARAEAAARALARAEADLARARGPAASQPATP